MIAKNPNAPSLEESSPSAGKIYGYLRVSHLDSLKSGLGIEVQRTSVQAYVTRLLERLPALEFGGWFQDEAVSAYRFDLAKRPDGRTLTGLIQPGDHVVFFRVERAFRRVRDLASTVESWLDKNVGVHFADQNIDATTPSGMLQLNIMGSTAQFEAAMTSQRVRESNAVLRTYGRPPGGCAPMGLKWWRAAKGKLARLLDDKEQRRVMQHVVRLHDEQGMSFQKIADELERIFAEAEGRAPRTRAFHGYWHKVNCFRAYYAEKGLQQLERENAEKKKR